MENQSWIQKTMQTVMKWIKRVLVIALLILIGLFIFSYWGTYSEGIRSGMVVKISKKGWLFKTHEGQLNLQTFGANKSPNIVSESFEFSVESNNQGVVKALEEASLSGERVSLAYTERLVRFPWRGDTKYFITKVERVEN
jgi:hypothetical protein